MASALEGIKVVDVSQVAAVPMCARHLADFGADVIHVENAATGDSWRGLQAGAGGGGSGVPSDFHYNWEAFNRNKRSLALDLSQEAGKKILCKLVEKADVFVTNLRLWEREKFGVEYDTLSKLNRRLIYGSVTGHGKKGPDKNMPAYDTTVYWARAGVTHTLALPAMSLLDSRPAFGDVVAGLGLAFGVMVALYVRDRTGEGQEIDISLFQTALYQLTFDVAGALATGQDYQEWRMSRPVEDEELGKRRDKLVAEAEAAVARLTDFLRENTPAPLATSYETKDGEVLRFNAGRGDHYWPIFCQAIEREDLANDPRFNSMKARRENHLELYHILKEAFLSKTLDEWKPRLGGIPVSPYQNLAEVVNDPQARENDFFVPFDHPTYGRIEVIANPVNLSETPATVRMPAPEFSQHTEEVLLELGYTWEDIARFKQQGIIA